MLFEVIKEILKKILDVVPLKYILIILFLIFLYIKKQWFKKYLSALLNIKFLADLKRENIEDLKNYLKINVSFVSNTSKKLRISYVISNFSIFDVTMYKLLEDKVELSGGNHSMELPKSDFQKERTIHKQRSEVLEIERKLDQADISKIIDKINESKEFGTPLILTVPIVGYFKCKKIKEPVEIGNTCGFRIPHYDLNFK